MIAIRSNANPATLLVGLFVLAVAAARATSTALVFVSCVTAIEAHKMAVRLKLASNLDVSHNIDPMTCAQQYYLFTQSCNSEAGMEPQTTINTLIQSVSPLSSFFVITTPTGLFSDTGRRICTCESDWRTSAENREFEGSQSIVGCREFCVRSSRQIKLGEPVSVELPNLVVAADEDAGR